MGFSFTQYFFQEGHSRVMVLKFTIGVDVLGTTLNLVLFFLWPIEYTYLKPLRFQSKK